MEKLQNLVVIGRFVVGQMITLLDQNWCYFWSFGLVIAPDFLRFEAWLAAAALLISLVYLSSLEDHLESQ